MGKPQDGEITFDWGINAALLFGRQKMRGHHQSTERYHGHKYSANYRKVLHHYSYNPSRSRSITVPNVGGFAGFSLRWPNAKVSLGYRGDFFFGAMDGGVDTRKNETLGFNGPYASISVGLGD